MITTVKDGAFYGRACNQEGGCGIVVFVSKVIILGLYSEPTYAAHFIPKVSHFAEEMRNLGY